MGGQGEGVTWGDLSMEEFIMREENLHEGGAENKWNKSFLNWK